jgi:hypothetical protein
MKGVDAAALRVSDSPLALVESEAKRSEEEELASLLQDQWRAFHEVSRFYFLRLSAA